MPQLAEPFELPESFTSEKRERLLQAILHMYDRADEVMKSTFVDDVRRRKKLIAIAAPYLTQIRCSTDILLAFYNEVTFKGRPITRDLQDTFETAIRNTFFAMNDFLDDMKALIPPDEIDPSATTVIETLALTLPPMAEAD